MWVQDPDGYRWEIWVRTGEHDSMSGVGVFEEIRKAEDRACC